MRPRVGFLFLVRTSCCAVLSKIKTESNSCFNNNCVFLTLSRFQWSYCRIRLFVSYMIPTTDHTSKYSCWPLLSKMKNENSIQLFEVCVLFVPVNIQHTPCPCWFFILFMEIQKKGPWSPNYDTDVLLIHGKAVKSVDNAKPCHRITGYDRHSIRTLWTQIHGVIKRKTKNEMKEEKRKGHKWQNEKKKRLGEQIPRK